MFLSFFFLFSFVVVVGSRARKPRKEENKVRRTYAVGELMGKEEEEEEEEEEDGFYLIRSTITIVSSTAV